MKKRLTARKNDHRRKPRGPYKCRGISKSPDYARNYYAARKAAGICTQCGKPNKDRPGKTRCGECHNNPKRR
jgi:hypothetical protein